ncbi:MAG: AAA family ATPase [Aestuariivirga sp.]
MYNKTSTTMSETQGFADTKQAGDSARITNFYAHYANKMAEQGFPVLPIIPGDKYPAIPTIGTDEDGKPTVAWRHLSGWQDGFRLLDDATSAMMGDSSVGILAGHGESPVIGIDVDLLDKSQVEMIRRCAVEHLGSTALVRQGQAPKILMVYRTEKPIQSFSQGKIDIIGTGRQFVAFGRHPSGTDYTWKLGESSPAETPVSDLPLVTPEMLDKFFAALAEKHMLKDAGLDFSTRKSEYQSISGQLVADPDKIRGSEEVLREALKNIPNRGGWQDWNYIGMAVYAASGGAGWGFSLYDNWSQTSPRHGARNQSGKGDTTVDRWAHYHRSPPTRNAGAKAIFKMAQELSGWNEGSIAGAYPDRPDLSGNLAKLQERAANRESKAQLPDRQVPTCQHPSQLLSSMTGKPQPVPDPDVSEPVRRKIKPGHRPSTAPTSTLPPRQWIYGKRYLAGAVTATVATGGSGKSMIALTEGLVIATGKPMLGVTPIETRSVWFYNAEEPRDELERRIGALRNYYGLDPQTINDRVLLHSLEDGPFKIVVNDGNSKYKVDDEVVREIEEIIKEHDIGLMVVDPLVSFSEVPENENKIMDVLVKVFAGIAVRRRCAIHLVHHTRKPEAGQKVTVLDSRGAVSLHDGVRAMFVLNKAASGELQKWGEDSDAVIVALKSGKGNYSKPGADDIWLKFFSVPLGNPKPPREQDWVGVPVPFKPPSASEEFADLDFAKVAGILGSDEHRYSGKAGDWVGYKIAATLKWHLSESGVKERTTRLINKMVKDGTLEKFQGQDSFRKPVPCVRVASVQRQENSLLTRGAA